MLQVTKYQELMPDPFDGGVHAASAVSIRAPREGGDHLFGQDDPAVERFNPRPP